nr:hypothetical protein [Tanacetum cinerariifolium]
MKQEPFRDFEWLGRVMHYITGSMMTIFNTRQQLSVSDSIKIDPASKISKSSCDGCWVAKSRITCVNTNGNTMLSKAHGVSLRITSGMRVKMDIRSFMIQGVDGKFNFLPEGGFKDSQGSFFVKFVNNETPILDVKPISATLLASKVAGDASTPLDIDSDPNIHKREVKRDKAYADLEKKCNESLQDLDKNPLVSHMRSKTETLQGQVNGLHNEYGLESERERIKASEIQMLQEIERAAIVHGRCTVFEEIAKLKEPFVREKMPGYHMSSKDEYDRAEEDIANASFLFLSEFTSNPYAFVEQYCQLSLDHFDL